jgi:cation diffusion facilitator family transporter
MNTDFSHEKSRVALLSVASNTVLVILKLVIGIMIGSVSVISEAIHSGMDWTAAIIAWFSVKKSGKPPDVDHAFGHGKIENFSGVIEALLIFLAAIWIVSEAVKRLIHPEPFETAWWGIGVMLISAVMNMIVSQLLFRVGIKTDSMALKADAWHLRTDVYTSAGVMVGLAMIWIGQNVLPDYNFNRLDPICAIAVALLIVKIALKLMVQSGRDLLDSNLPEEERAWIRTLLESHRDLIYGYHYLRTRKAGHFRFIEFHLQVDQQMSVLRAHQLTQKLSKAIKDHLPDSTVTIHIEPCTGNCNDKCLSGCLLTEPERYLVVSIIRDTIKKNIKEDFGTPDSL